jgi:uncharacterized integral membrane protein (TIGR00698 family)
MFAQAQKKLQFSEHIFSISFFFLLAMAAFYLSQIEYLKNIGLGLLTISMLIGMLCGNFMPQKMHTALEHGMTFCKQRLLRIAVAFYGFRLSIQQIQALGIQAFVIDVVLIFTTMGMAIWLGIKLLKLEKETAILIGAGHAICGAAAILATSSIVKARNEQVAVAVSCIVLFGTIGMFLYPWIYQYVSHVFVTDRMFGIFTGATLHEVAQVVAAGQAMTPQAAEAAVVTKLIRVLLLAPFLLLLCYWLTRNSSSNQSAGSIALPIFVFGFIACMLFNSLVNIPEYIHSVIIFADDLALATAMVALGVSVRIVDLKKAGLKPILLAFVLTLQLMAVGGFLSLL